MSLFVDSEKIEQAKRILDVQETNFDLFLSQLEEVRNIVDSEWIGGAANSFRDELRDIKNMIESCRKICQIERNNMSMPSFLQIRMFDNLDYSNWK